MTRLSRTLMVVAAAMLGVMYVVPLWRIDLVAPQYPEGLGMYIRIDAVTGLKPNDLDNINGLNHYIGMRPIVSDAIPELRWMPWILAGLIATGLAVAAIGKRRLVVGWLAAFAALGAAGLYRFWAWGYDYGHNLDMAHAIIKVPGMAYQPPLIGSKQLLNFTATSWPDWGTLVAALSVAFAVGAYVTAREARAEPRRRAMPSASRVRSAALLLLAILVGCGGGGPRPLAYDGTESCEFCRMAVTDRRFGTQLVTNTGKVLAFDSIECLAGYVRQAQDAGTVRDVYVTDAGRPGTLIPAARARFVRVEGPSGSPMGLGLVAFADAEAARSAGGRTLDWQAVLSLVGQEAAAHAAH